MRFDAKTSEELARHDAGEDLSARLWLLLTLEVWMRSLSKTRGEVAAALPSTV